MQEILKIAAYAVAVAPAMVFGVYCTVSAVASRIEDKLAEDINIETPISHDGNVIDIRDYMRDLPKAA